MEFVHTSSTSDFATQSVSVPVVSLQSEWPPVSAEPMPRPQVAMLGMRIDAVTLAEASHIVLHWATVEPSGLCRYVVTPNVDHAVLLSERADLREAYRSASLVLADGAPLIAVSQFLGKPLPERVAGSDLVPSVFALASETKSPLRVFLLGAGPGVAERAAAAIHSRYAGVRVIGTHCPPVGFERNEMQNAAALEAIAATKPDLLVIGLGARKQELWVHQHAHQIDAQVALCAGATIDFLAGEKRRSPVWMQKCGLEWLHRLASEPRRLGKRYAHDALVFPRLVFHECLATPSAESDV